MYSPVRDANPSKQPPNPEKLRQAFPQRLMEKQQQSAESREPCGPRRPSLAHRAAQGSSGPSAVQAALATLTRLPNTGTFTSLTSQQ